MKEQPELGVNRTGVQMSPIQTGEMANDVSNIMPPPTGDAGALTEMRSRYITEAEPIGSVPVPGTVRGALTTGVSMLTGNSPQLLLDKLGERLAFERTGTRLYDALLAKVMALQQNGASTLSIDRLMHIREEEASHFVLVADAIRTLGGDPTSQTPCADLAGVESMGLMQVLTDPRTSVAQSLHAMLVAEMTDNNGWDMLIAIARDQNHDALAADFSKALAHEREHLQQIQTWFEEATLGSAMSDMSTAGAPSLH
jgi:ferritin-like protein